jgi:nucleoside-diphosphate-sugar epimerase
VGAVSNEGADVTTALVTGANGFVGRALIDGLRRRGWDVRAAVRNSAAAEALAPGSTVVVVGDVDGDTDWSDALRDVDVVFHLAARVHVMDERAVDPLAEFRRVNTEGTMRLGHAAAARGVRRLVYLSTIKVNGERTSSEPFRAADPACPEDPYAVSKWEAEQGLRSLASETDLEVTVVRPPLVYGPGVKGNLLRLLATLDRETWLPLAGVRNARSLIGLENLVDVLIQCANNPRAVNQTLLVSDGEDLSTPELVRRLARALGRRQRLIMVPPFLLRMAAKLSGRGAEFERLTGSLQIDANETRSRLAWTPPQTVDQGLAETAEWFLASKAN